MKETDAKMDQEKINTPSIDLDKILVEEIGFGWFRLRTIVLSGIAVIFSGVVNSEFVFTSARINTRCFIPECESIEQYEFSPSWILNAVPASGSSVDGCRRFANSSVNIANVSESCPSNLFDVNNIVNCDNFVYENTNTVVYTFGLACQEWQRSFIGTARNIGMLVVLPLAGYASDRWGRRKTLAVSATIRASIGLTRSWINGYVGFTILEFLEASLGSGVFTSAYILASMSHTRTIPGYWTSMFLLGKIGRKPVLICSYWICAACQAAYVFMPEGYYGISLTVYLIGKFTIAMVMTGIYIYTAELYPTKHRHSLLAFSSMIGRTGSILAALSPAIGNSTFDDLPFVLFGIFALLSGCLVFVTPETLGAKFPDTIDEASNIEGIRG